MTHHGQGLHRLVFDERGNIGDERPHARLDRPVRPVTTTLA